jgi:ABC-type transport system involved in multi-copper enzyme maturation permease subunit
MSGLRLVPTIVRLTLFEALRRRTLWALVVLTGVIVVLTGLGFEYLVSQAREHGSGELRLQLGVSQVLILCAFMFSFILAATAAFLSAPAIASDIESGVLQAMLARPLGRGTFVAGRWIGLAIVIAAYGVVAGLLEIGAMKLASGYGPPDPFGAVGGLAAQAVVVLTVTLLLSSRIPAIASGAVAVVMFGLAWGIGVLGGVGAALGVDTLETVSSIARVVFPSDGLWRGTIFALEPGVVIAAITANGSTQVLQANPFFAVTGPSPVYLVWCGLWVVGVLGLTVASFRRREL